MEISNFLISATSSGSGKTTLTLGLLRAINNRGFKVQSFKCGPDYIDTLFHYKASGSNCINLDLFLSSESHVKNIYNNHIINKDVAIVEGVMGLFDGANKMKGSSAEIANLLNLPIIIVINAKAMAYSAAPLIYGFKNFYKNINIVGAIFNFVGSESHYNFLKEACADVGVKSLGYLPKNLDIEIPSRHLGLNIDSKYLCDNFIDKVASEIESHIDIDSLIQLTKVKINNVEPKNSSKIKNLKISVAKDDAFCFFYQENIDYLHKYGQINFFSPISDSHMPETDLLYIPGGYPELYLEELSNNISMKNSIKKYIESGGKAIAECGGMMYLSSSIKNNNGDEFPMVDALKHTTTMKNRKLSLGYRSFDYFGIDIKGHEFHYSSVEKENKEITLPIKFFNARGDQVDTKLYKYKNLLASYTHIYWAEIDDIMALFDK